MKRCLLSLAIVVAMAGCAFAGTLRGVVTDLFGLPLQKATIEIRIGDRSFRSSSRADGTYELENLPPGEGVITVSMKGFEKGVQSFTIREFQALYLDVGLEIGALPEWTGKISGAITSVNRMPLKDAEVVWLNPFNSRHGGKTKTDGWGRYRIVVTQPGQYLVYAVMPGYELRSITTKITIAHTIDEQNLVLLPLEQVHRR